MARARRRYWPSKIGTMPGPIILVKGYPYSPPPVGARIQYVEAHITKGGNPIRLPGYPWRTGYVTRTVGDGISALLCIDHDWQHEENNRG